LHLVASDYDTGPIIAQTTVPVMSDDSVDAIEARVKSAERALLVDTLRGIREGRLKPELL
jgi:phosphoribosylglycinamide formyltransferase-1